MKYSIDAKLFDVLETLVRSDPVNTWMMLEFLSMYSSPVFILTFPAYAPTQTAVPSRARSILDLLCMRLERLQPGASTQNPACSSFQEGNVQKLERLKNYFAMMIAGEITIKDAQAAEELALRLSQSGSPEDEAVAYWHEAYWK